MFVAKLALKVPGHCDGMEALTKTQLVLALAFPCGPS